MPQNMIGIGNVTEKDKEERACPIRENAEELANPILFDGE